MLAIAVLYCVLMPAGSRVSIGSAVLITLAVLAALGEVLELVAGSAGVSKAGGSRRSVVYAILGSIAGAMAGLVIGVPIPVVGPIIGCLFLGSVGAMMGAMYGEWSTGRGWKGTFQIGKAAFWGRAMGTVAKMIVGLMMLFVALVGVLV
jgi:uncharacterized protein YqgC (DUF456 family)